MLVRSTGLGKTPMIAKIAMLEFARLSTESLKEDADSEQRMILRLETIKPAAWQITAFMGPDDMRDLAKKLLKPRTLIQALFYLFGSSNSSVKVSTGEEKTQ